METAYRLAALLLLVLAGMGRVAAGRRRPPPPVAARRPETGFRFLTFALLPAFAAFLVYLLGGGLAAFQVPLAGWLRGVGAGLMLLADVVLFWAHRALGAHWSPVLELYEGHRLVTTGPYRLVRHPMYAAWLLLCVGLSLLTANAAVALAWTAGMVVVLAARVPAEERMLLEAFGGAFRDYQARTGALFPRLWER